MDRVCRDKAVAKAIEKMGKKRLVSSVVVLPQP